MGAIYLENVNKVYKRYIKQDKIFDNFFRRKYENKVAVNDMSLEIQSGECIAIIGQNGAGKTTIMKMLSGLLLPSSGKIEVFGFTPFEKKKEYKKNIALLLGQKQQLWWDISAADNFVLLRDIYELRNEEYKRNLRELIEMLNMEEIINSPIRTLSLGERMKCELAGALLHRPKVLFLDEPTIGLDLIAQNEVRKFVKEYSENNGATVILTSHNMDDIEAVCKRTIFIEQGKKYYDGTLTDFISEYGEDGVLNVEYVGDSQHIDWERHGLVMKKERNAVRIRIPKKEKQKIRDEIERIPGVVNITFDELDAGEIVRDFYERDK